MHSSRMRTTRTLTHCISWCPGDVHGMHTPLPCTPPTCRLPTMHTPLPCTPSQQTPVDRILDMLLKILPCPNFVAGGNEPLGDLKSRFEHLDGQPIIFHNRFRFSACGLRMIMDPDILYLNFLFARPPRTLTAVTIN